MPARIKLRHAQGPGTVDSSRPTADKTSMKLRSLLELSIVALAIVVVTPADAWAYLDPGTGSYLFQILIAGGLAAAYTFRGYWNALKTAVQGKRRDTSGTTPPNPPNGMA